MSDEKALLAAIWEHPNEDTPRLVYADWLDEHDQPARAEFIRVQCELARLDEWDDEARIEPLKRRERELWIAHKKEWKAVLPKELNKEYFQRGFVYPRLRRFGGAKFLAQTPGAFDSAPQWTIELRLFARLFDKVFRSPHLIRFNELHLNMHKCPHDPFEKWAGNDLLRNVSNLELRRFNTIRPESFTSFFNGPAAGSLTHLRVGEQVSGDAVAALAATHTALRLRTLELSLSDVKPGTGSLFSSAPFPKLRRLHISISGDGADLVPLLAATPEIPLRQLGISCWSLGDKELEQLAAWPGLSRLREFRLNCNTFGATGYLALARSPHVGNLKRLDVPGFWGNEVPEVVKAEFKARFGAILPYG